MSLIARLDKFPPVLCRLAARKNNGRRALTNEEIAKAAGLSKKCVDRLSVKATWSGVDVETASKFAAGCGVDLLHPRRQKDFLRRRKKSHFEDNPKYFARLTRILAESIKTRLKSGARQ
ncbi:MAG TPA: hypothetical protein VEH27_11915 [Methylomirabilota bacterium]|nr:hypothetical protein [Methylomirabilota bacterium]